MARPTKDQQAAVDLEIAKVFVITKSAAFARIFMLKEADLQGDESIYKLFPEDCKPWKRPKGQNESLSDLDNHIDTMIKNGNFIKNCEISFFSDNGPYYFLRFLIADAGHVASDTVVLWDDAFKKAKAEIDKLRAALIALKDLKKDDVLAPLGDVVTHRGCAEIPLATALYLRTIYERDRDDVAQSFKTIRAIETRIWRNEGLLSEEKPGWLQHYLEYMARYWKLITGQQPSNTNFKSIAELGLQCLGANVEIKDYQIEKINGRVQGRKGKQGYCSDWRMEYDNIQKSIEERAERKKIFAESIDFMKNAHEEGERSRILSILRRALNMVNSAEESAELTMMLNAASGNECDL